MEKDRTNRSEKNRYYEYGDKLTPVERFNDNEEKRVLSRLTAITAATWPSVESAP
jgi:hypothetical protein